MSTNTATSIEKLSRDECLNLLQFNGFVGRIGFVVEGRPLILPVNYFADESSIVFVTPAGTKLEHLASGVPVVFEIDDSRPLFHAGWSVIVQGTAQEVVDHEQLEGLRRGPLHSWALTSAEHWIRVTIEDISGRRILES